MKRWFADTLATLTPRQSNTARDTFAFICYTAVIFRSVTISRRCKFQHHPLTNSRQHLHFSTYSHEVCKKIQCSTKSHKSRILFQTRWSDLLKYTHTHPFNGPFSGTTWVGRHQKGKTNRDFTEARDSKWQWHQLGHMQVCTLLQTDNHASTSPLVFYRPDALPATQPTVSKHWRPAYWKLQSKNHSILILQLPT